MFFFFYLWNFLDSSLEENYETLYLLHLVLFLLFLLDIILFLLAKITAKLLQE